MYNCKICGEQKQYASVCLDCGMRWKQRAEQAEAERDELKAEVERLHWRLGQIDECLEMGLDDDAREHIEQWKSQQQGGE